MAGRSCGVYEGQSCCFTRLPDDGNWVRLNVGGKIFLTTKTTLSSLEPTSMLGRMFAGDAVSPELRWESQRDSTGAYLIDRSGQYFECILNYLRHGVVVVESGLSLEGALEEALFYSLDGLADALKQRLKASQEKREAEETCLLGRNDVVRALIQSSSQAELRFQGTNLTGADLSLLDLQHVNFKHANLQDCDLSGSNLSYCNLERANMQRCKLDGAQLLSVRMVCTNLESASMKCCNFDDPSGAKASMEGANLKGAVLEGSQMCGVNLRVATLKNANLKNCDLRSAVLAGADLENCDLSGSDLHEANLRGANFVGATFELMITPLHMSQTVRM